MKPEDEYFDIPKLWLAALEWKDSGRGMPRSAIDEIDELLSRGDSR